MSSLSLREELTKKDEEFYFSDDIFGMTLLNNPGYVSSARNVMFTSHLRQFVNLVNPESPKVFTNYENVVGKNSTGYYKSPSEVEIVDIVPRFKGGGLDKHLYTMFVYDKKADRYDVIDKRCVEDLTEKFGYSYNNERMDKKEIGDIVEKDELLYTTTSYDEDFNYGYGRNTTVMWTLDNRTIEDAIVVSKSYAESMISKEIETVTVPLNDNDILCNIYGDGNEYKCFPDIGEYVNNRIVCAKRRIHNSQVLFDLKKSNLRKINVMNDTLFFNSGRLVDIFIYSNKTLDELEDNIFNRQIRKYLIAQTEYFEAIYDRCREIIKSGSKYSSDISFLYKKAKDILDDSCAWKEENNSAFNHLVIEFQFERDSQITIGSKISARFGNKGVVSTIVDDDEMPFLANGKRVDCILNALGVINRLNPAQSYESSINFICNCVRDRLDTLTTLKEKEKLLFDIVKRFNEEQCKELKEYYHDLYTQDKKRFWEDIRETGIFIHNPPLWEKEPMFNKLRKIYADYDWIKPVDVYINKFGRKIKILKPMIIGELYMMKLKQNSKKGFSARSTGALSKRGVPEKSYRAKAHQDLYSTTPIRIGDQENQNIMIGVESDIVAKLHMYYRSSVVARKALAKQLALNVKPLKNFGKEKTFTNRNAEILAAYFKSMGLRLKFLSDKYVIDIDAGNYESYEDENGMFIGTLSDFRDRELRAKIKKKYTDDICYVGPKDEFLEIVEKEVALEKKKKTHMIIDINV